MEQVTNTKIDLSILKPHQKKRLQEFYNSILNNASISPVQLSKKNTCCPSCSSNSFVKNGKRGDKQRYKCNSCKTSFTSTTNTSIHNIKKVDTWTDFICLLLESRVPPTLRELSEKLYISTKTAHVWKHKFLSALNKQDNVSLSGTIEMDEVFLPFCVKGKIGHEKTPKIIRHEAELKADNQNSMFLCVHNRDNDFDFVPIKIQQKGATTVDILSGVIDKLDIRENTVVVTDSSKTSTAYFRKREDIQHETFISSGVKTDVLHNNHINNTMSLYKTWSKRFNGYSTKYVWNYLKWFRFHRKYVELNHLDSVVRKSVGDIGSNRRFIELPIYYNEFLQTA